MAKNASSQTVKSNAPRSIGPDVFEMAVTATPAAATGRTDLVIPLEGFPPSSKKFVASAVAIVEAKELFHIVFLQQRLDGRGIRSLLDVQIMHLDWHQFGASCKNLSVDVSEQSELQKVESEPEQAVAVSASFIRAAQHENGSSQFDLFYISPLSLTEAGATKKVVVDAVARVAMPRGVFNACVTHALQYSQRSDAK